MHPIDQALREVQALHERLTQSPAPEIAPHAFLPFPPGSDPVAYALREVEQLKQLLSQRPSAGQNAQWIPHASVFASDNGICFAVELPGVENEDVSVTVTNGELIVRGQRKPVTVDGGFKPVVLEQMFGSFERRFPVPNWCHPDTVTARCDRGVLHVQISRPEDEAAFEFSVEID